MRRLLPLLMSLILVLSPTLATSAEPAKPAQPLAVLIAADWCYNCKQIKPKLAELRRRFESKINFVNLDVTDDARFLVAWQQAGALGIGYLLDGQFATGWVALIDRHGKKIGELHQEMGIDEMQSALQKLSGPPG